MIEKSKHQPLDHSLIKSWIQLARWAPSGGNAQPWSAAIQNDNSVHLILSIDKDYKKEPSLLDLDGSTSIMALGTFTENLQYLARLDGYKIANFVFKNIQDFFEGKIEITFAPDNSIPNYTADEKDKKIQILKNRHTNRNLYQKTEIPLEFINWIKKEAQELGFNFVLFSSSDSKLISALTRLEKIRWENKKLLLSLLDELTFDNNRILTGIPFSHLGTSLLEQYLLMLFKKFNFLGFLMPYGISWIIKRKSIRMPLEHCGLFIYLHTPLKNYEVNFKLGRLFEKIWLEGSALGLSFQPLCGHLIAYYSLIMQNPYSLNPQQQQEIADVSKKYKENWDIGLDKPLFGFRIGYPLKPGSPSQRKPVKIIET